MALDTRAAARRWAEVWQRGWRDHDIDAIAALYARGCEFRSHPFRAAQAPRDYVGWAFADEEPGAECRFGEPVVDGERAAVRWRAILRDARGEHTLAGVSLLRFDGGGLVVWQRDYWAGADGRVEEPAPAW